MSRQQTKFVILMQNWSPNMKYLFSTGNNITKIKTVKSLESYKVNDIRYTSKPHWSF